MGSLSPSVLPNGTQAFSMLFTLVEFMIARVPLGSTLGDNDPFILTLCY